MELKYWTKIALENKKRIEDFYLKQKKTWDLINENLQKMDLPGFEIFYYFKEQA